METLKQIEEKVKLFIDAANQKIDPEIFKLIIGLQAHNIPTQFYSNHKAEYKYMITPHCSIDLV